MGLFDSLFGKRQEPLSLNPYMERIARYARASNIITWDAKRTPALTASKLGGDVYWPEGWSAYPRDTNGLPMILLAQLNMAELHGLPDFPEQGLLQFFVQADPTAGVDFEQPRKQSNFRIVWHDSIPDDSGAHKIPVSQISTELGDVKGFVLSSWEDGVSMSFTLAQQYIPIEDGRVEAILPELDSVKGFDGAYTILLGDTEKSRVGGYARFDQYDPRDPSASDYPDELLLGLQSVLKRDAGFEMMWGDYGVASFMIRSSDLRARDFSKVWYHWDCG